MMWVPPVMPRRRHGGTGNSLLCRRGWREGLWTLQRGRGVGTAAAATAPRDQNTSRAAYCEVGGVTPGVEVCGGTWVGINKLTLVKF